MNKLIPAIATAALFVSSTVLAQTPTPTPPGTQPATPSTMAPAHRLAPVQPAPVLTEDEAKALIDAPVISSDNRTIGDVTAIQRDSEGKVVEIRADIGGFLGIGQTRVRVTPSQFTISNNRILLTLTAQQAGQLPTIEQ